MVARTYQVASRQLLRQGREELSQGDTRQAAEKGWGAAAQIVKAIAESRGWTHGGHGHLFTTVRDLREETGDEEIGRLFHVANSLAIRPIIAQLRIVLFGGSAAQLIVGCESRKPVVRRVLCLG